MISLLKDKEIKLSNRYIEQNGTLKETTNQLMKETVHTLKLNDKYIILLSHVSLDKLSEKLGLPFIKAIDEKKEFINISKENKNIFIENSFHEFKEKMNKQLDIQLSDGLLEYLLNESVEDINGFLDDVFERLFDFKEKYSSDIDIVYKDHDLYVCDELLFSKENIGFEDIDQQLHNLVGLEEVKQSLEDLKQYYKIVQIRKNQGKKTTDVNKHMIFTGNPGTGKTTVARILSKYLKAANILESGHLIEVTRKDLVGQYVGHTAKLTHQVITSALGGVLFIDEAYSLYRGNNDSYGLEAIDTLVKAMEDHRDEFVVILAGYDKEMDTFLQSNSGLRSRFTNIIHFSDYSGEDLYKIACQIASSHDYTIDESCKDELISYLDKSNKELGGNGRLARNVVEKAMIQNAKRENSDILILEDFDIQKGSE
jgi:SpoVK/Ycf46/Vps4 family AAA+-type ATPase